MGRAHWRDVQVIVSVELIVIYILLALAVLVSIRLFIGPTVQDRLISAVTLSIILILILAIHAVVEGEDDFLDIAIPFMTLDFIATIAYTKYLGKEGER